MRNSDSARYGVVCAGTHSVRSSVLLLFGRAVVSQLPCEFVFGNGLLHPIREDGAILGV